jgi:hypothetical protein
MLQDITLFQELSDNIAHPGKVIRALRASMTSISDLGIHAANPSRGIFGIQAQVFLEIQGLLLSVPHRCTGLLRKTDTVRGRHRHLRH